MLQSCIEAGSDLVMEKGAIAQAVEVMGILFSLKQHSLAMALQCAVFICGHYARTLT